MADNRRTSDRPRAHIAGELRGEQGASFQASIRDVTSRGARVRTDARLVAGAVVTLEIASSNARFQASVRWQRGDEVGLQFIPPAGGSEAVDEHAFSFQLQLAELQRKVASLGPHGDVKKRA